MKKIKIKFLNNKEKIFFTKKPLWFCFAHNGKNKEKDATQSFSSMQGFTLNK